ncbi:MAG: hypothetical protein Q4G10_02845 [Bacteroidia bacterium]|nr:hypothetical protein [Bacteroidia bacterium]
MTVGKLFTVILSLTWLLAGSGFYHSYAKDFTIERDGVIVTITDEGEVILHNWAGDIIPAMRLALKGKVTGLAVNDAICIGVTDSGEIFTSKDGRTWDITDFNKAYEGYYPKIGFVGVAAGVSSVAVAGVTETNAPAVYISTRGTVWSERTLNYFSGEEQFYLNELPVSISADLERDEFVLECTDDTWFFLPSCSHCNRLEYRGH